ncbi:MAG TPA: hypothetical protein VHB72_04235 [Candidatus Saccharimonadales bacterium]|nr:hypothetical protein [Candidatus Saccharimonadales bacterium]
MVIVGLSGGIGSGKTTLADYLAALPYRSEHWESWQLIAEVATALRAGMQGSPSPDNIGAITLWLKPLPQILSAVCHKSTTLEQLHLSEADFNTEPKRYAKLLQYHALMQSRPELQKVAITAQNKELFRPLLQWLGGYLAATCGGDIWYGEIVRRIQQQKDIEVAIIGGVRFPADAACITQAGGIVLGIIRPDLESRDTDDPTERERSGVKTDAVVYNDGTLEELQKLAPVLMQDILKSVLQKEYRASTIK